MRRRLARLERELEKNREKRIVFVEQNDQGRWLFEDGTQAVEFESEDELDKYIEELKKKRGCDYQIIRIVEVE